MAWRGELGAPGDRLPGGGRQVVGDGGLHCRRQALHQDRKDEDQAGNWEMAPIVRQTSGGRAPRDRAPGPPTGRRAQPTPEWIKVAARFQP